MCCPKKILNETKNHNPPPFKLNGRSLMNREPKNVEELRHCATLAEKSASASESNLQSAVNNMQSDIQSIKDHLTSNTAIVDQVNCSYNNNTGHNLPTHTKSHTVSGSTIQFSTAKLLAAKLSPAQ